MQGHASPVGTVLSVEFSSHGQVSWKAREKTESKKYTDINSFHFHSMKSNIHRVAALPSKAAFVLYKLPYTTEPSAVPGHN